MVPEDGFGDIVVDGTVAAQVVTESSAGTCGVGTGGEISGAGDVTAAPADGEVTMLVVVVVRAISDSGVGRCALRARHTDHTDRRDRSGGFHPNR
jgi:hypothetical protein